VSQFAARHGVSRIRVLQWLAQKRIPGARKIGHYWTVPASARPARRRPGRPRKAPERDAAPLLRRLARKYVWWLPPGQALRRPGLLASQVMEMGEYDDACALENALGREALIETLRRAQPGRFSEASWRFWHYRLGLARAGARVPALPRRRVP